MTKKQSYTDEFKQGWGALLGLVAKNELKADTITVCSRDGVEQ